MEIDDGATHRLSHLHRFGDLLRSQSPHDFAIARLGNVAAGRTGRGRVRLSLAPPLALDEGRGAEGARLRPAPRRAHLRWRQPRLRPLRAVSHQPRVRPRARRDLRARAARRRGVHARCDLCARRHRTHRAWCSRACSIGASSGVFPSDRPLRRFSSTATRCPSKCSARACAPPCRGSPTSLVRLERITWADTARSPLDQDFWLILDEIDQGLHPQLQMRLFPALRELFPRARIYATTHSPFVVALLGDGVVFLRFALTRRRIACRAP